MGKPQPVPVQARFGKPRQSMGSSRITLGIFLQVRLGSVRLPNKALLPLRGGTVLDHALRALAGVSARSHVVLTDPESADVLRP